VDEVGLCGCGIVDRIFNQFSLKMKVLSNEEVEVVSGGIVPLLIIAAAALLSGCATINGPNNSNLRKDYNGGA
jgi:lactobin A/cerein 7B family class IIb bacteriocin